MQLLNVDGFEKYISSLKVTRSIKLIQLHHTYSPSYKQFNGQNHLRLQQNMQTYHIKNNGWSDIGQHFTIFPDGLICTGRSLNSSPAGIKGANTGAICIECLGNFDVGGDVMNQAQKDAIVSVVKILLERFGLNAKKAITYHAWWTAAGKSLGDYVRGKSAKTCPGTNFFGGNSKEAFEKNLLSLLEDYGTGDDDMALKPITKINDIVWELANAGIISDSNLWIEKCKEDTNVYWLCRKMANKLRGTL